MPEPSGPAFAAPVLNPAGFTEMLRESGALPTGEVTHVAITLRRRTTISRLWFATITCDPPAPDLPTRVVIKWPLDVSAPPDWGASERAFYTELAPSLGSPPVVRCLAVASPSANPQWILLEDLRDTHTHRPWPEPPSPEEARGAVLALAQLHARWWEAPALGSTVGSLHTEASLREMVHGIAAQLPGFLAALGHTLGGQDRRLLEAVFGSSLAPWLRLADPRALTVAHGDAHAWNFLFPRSGAGLPYLVDWQTWHLDLGARDLAYMIALHWGPALRRDAERSLLELYHRSITAGGVAGYPFEDLWLDYRRCAVRNLTFPIIYWSRGFPPEAWRHRLDCALAAYRDLACAELL